MSGKLTDALIITPIVASAPTDLMYIARPADGAAGSHSITADDLLALITNNLADGTLRFDDFAAPSLSGAGQGALYFDSTRQRFLASENAGPFMPLQQSMFLEFGGVVTVVNSAVETALLGAALDGSTKTITPAMTRVGRTFRLWLGGVFASTGAPVLTVRLKLTDGVTPVTIQTFTSTIAAITTTAWRLDLFATITAIGAGGAILVRPGIFEYAHTAPGVTGPTQWIQTNAGAVAVDFSVNQTWELTIQWGTAAAGNSFSYLFGNIDIVR